METEISRGRYDLTSVSLLLALGKEWDRTGFVYVLRSCILTPYLTNLTTYLGLLEQLHVHRERSHREIYRKALK